MALIGYARVSTRDQNPGAQEGQLQAAGAERVFTDHGKSSRLKLRPQLSACLDFLREGDTLMVYRLDRLAAEWHLIAIADDLGRRGINLRSLTEPVDTTTVAGRAFFGVMAVLNGMRLDTIRENTLDGLAAARAEGRIGGRPPAMTPAMITAARTLVDQGTSRVATAQMLGVSLSTLGRALKAAEPAQG